MSSRDLRWPSIQPWHSASSSASALLRRVGWVTPFFARTSHTAADSAWCSASQSRHAVASGRISSGVSGVAMPRP